MTCKICIALSILSLSACSQQFPHEKQYQLHISNNNNEANPYNTVGQVPLPEGFYRQSADSNAFSQWLRSIPLKKDRTVYLYNGQKKINQHAQFAVLDISVGPENLQQCADAVMRLRAEYLYSRHIYNDIVFSDNNGNSYRFDAPYSRSHFNAYLHKVFSMCGTASLSKQLVPVNFKEAIPGDVLIRGGFPGHAEIIMDIAVNKYGEKIFLLAQSYMPAQDIHLLQNPDNPLLSPWYTLPQNKIIETPEYTFTANELKRWK